MTLLNLKRATVWVCTLHCMLASSVILGQSEKRLASREMKDQLNLSADVALGSQQYCKGDNEIGFIKLALKVTFTNLGRNALMLNRGSGGVCRVLVARSIIDMKSGRLESDISISALMAQFSDEARRPIADLLIRLRPRQSYNVTTEARIPFLLSGTGPQSLGIRGAGAHWVSFVISTWPETSLTPNDAQQATGKLGNVWSANITSTPVKLEFPTNPVRSTCDH